MIIAVASGKGGTGKTTVAVNLAKVLEEPVQLLDCDVEEPNVHLFFPATPEETEEVSLLIPKPDEDKCDGCGECSEFCQFNAIVVFDTTPLVFPELCHSCGGCAIVCPQRAIEEIPKPIGKIETFQHDSITVVQGRLNIGVAMAPPLIRAVKRKMIPNKTVILDAPPGTSCPVITTVTDVDVAVLVTEPTPFGLHDLRLAVGMMREVGVPFGIFINRADIGDDEVRRFCDTEGIPILAEMPNDRRVAEVYSRGAVIVDNVPEYRPVFEKLYDELRRIASKNEGRDVS